MFQVTLQIVTITFLGFFWFELYLRQVYIGTSAAAREGDQGINRQTTAREPDFGTRLTIDATRVAKLQQKQCLIFISTLILNILLQKITMVINVIIAALSSWVEHRLVVPAHRSPFQYMKRFHNIIIGSPGNISYQCRQTLGIKPQS